MYVCTYVVGLRELCFKNSSLFYSKFPQKSLHYACYYSFYALPCCHYSILCSYIYVPVIIKFKCNVIVMHVQQILYCNINDKQLLTVQRTLNKLGMYIC